MNRFPLLLAAALMVAATGLAGHHKHQRTTATAGTGDIPAKAVEVYRYVLDHGNAPRGYVGGRRWENREHRLPAGRQYQEFDVNPKVRGKNRGPERIVVDVESRKGWYTGDHYRTFLLLPSPTSTRRSP